VRIVAQITAAHYFWSLSPPHVAVAEEAVAHTGAKALVAVNRPPSFQADYWYPVEGTPYSILLLR
jgi:hypothetical protein